MGTSSANPQPALVASKPKGKASTKAVGMVCNFPDGLSIADYPGYETWGNAAWAWQFLRRNEKFQERCDHIRSWPNSKLKRMWKANIAHAFGLKKFKDYIEDFDSGKTPQPKFASKSVSAWANIDKEQYESLVLPSKLRPGQVLLRFDLDAMGKTKKSLRAQIDDAHEALEALLAERLKVTDSSPKAPKPKAPFIEVLRAYDAEIYKQSPSGKGITYEVIAKAILPQFPGPPLDPVGDINSRIERGEEYVELLYLDLAATKSK